MTSPSVTEQRRLSVLDRGFVRLVDSMPHWDSRFSGDDRIVQAARVSYGAGTKTVREDAGLIRYLVKNKHTTPLEKVRFEFHVKLPISCARQWIRHRMGSFNEVSTRYSEVEEGEFYLPDVARMRSQDTKNRQGSGDELPYTNAGALCRQIMEQQQGYAYDAYKRLLELGLAREVARGVLPLDTYTQWYWTVDLHNLMHFLSLRLDAHAQWEMQQYGQAVLALAEPIAPAAFGAWREREDISA